MIDCPVVPYKKYEGKELERILDNFRKVIPVHKIDDVLFKIDNYNPHCTKGGFACQHLVQYGVEYYCANKHLQVDKPWDYKLQ